MNMSGMDMSTSSSSVDTAALVLRLVLLLSTAVVAGTALLRPVVGRATRRMVLVLSSASVVVAIADALSIALLPVSVPLAVAQLLVAVTLPVLLRWPRVAAWGGFALTLLVLAETSLGHSGIEFLTDTIYVLGAVVWLGLTVVTLTAGRQAWNTNVVRPRPVALTAGVLLTLAGLAQFAFAGIGFDRRLYDTGFGLTLLLVVLLPVALTGLTLLLPRLGRGGGRRVYPAGAVVVVVAFLAWTTVDALPRPPALPEPGVPLLAQASVADKQVALLVSPQRPGKNLVHFPDSTGGNLSVAAGGRSVPALPRAGSSGTWAVVDLPAGRSDLVVSRDDRQDTVEVDAGTAPGPASATGDDGPECASAALGGLLGGGRDVLNACPADALPAADAAALRKLVGFLVSKSAPAITVAGDGSPRSDQAAQVVRASAAAARIPVSDSPGPDNALVLVSGWSDAATRLHAVTEQQAAQHTYGSGVYLAPWLVHAPVVNSALTSFQPLRFNPRDDQALNYAIELANSFGGEPPSAAGFQRWLSAHRTGIDDGVAIYASAQVSAMPMDTGSGAMTGMDMGMGGGSYPGQWITGGTIVPITGPLSP
jgi:hypothetical protein